jgi:hypothetical protein
MRQRTGSSDQTEALREFRSGFYDCLTGWADALFELADALLAVPGPVGSVPALSLESVFRRSHGSLYKALARGGLDAERARDLQVRVRPLDWPAVFAVDTSSWPRCDAETSPERGFYHHPSRHSAGKPIVAGWNYSWIAQLNWSRDSWTAPVDVTRIPPREDTGRATAKQVRNLVRRLHLAADDPVPLFAFDAGYDPIALTVDLTDVRAQLAVRIRDDRVFYADPPPREPAAKGRPPRHGPPFRLADPTTWPTPDATHVAEDPRYGRIETTAWHGLHPKLARRGRWADATRTPTVTGTVIRVQVEHLPKPTGRAKKTLWLWWAGPVGSTPDPDLCWRAYIHRFDVEHTLRFAKNTLGWTTPALRTPEQADRWSWLIVAGYTQLRLARGLVADLRLPWERPRDPAKLTPTRVRRGFRGLSATLGSPASPPKSDTPGPGRPKGTHRPPRTRCPAIKKAA